jgi:type IV secretory pathway VirB2 component (pilin)
MMKIKKTVEKGVGLVGLLAYSTFALADPGGGDSITDGLQWWISFLGGKFGASILTIAIIASGIALLIDKISKETFIKILVGGGLIFGASAMVSAIWHT